jgi:hypothetical protein
MAAIERTRQQLRRLDAHLDVHGIHIEEGPADFQALNEWAKRQTADHLGFIAGGLVLESANVLSSLIGQASRPCIAAVSAKLIDSHGKPQGPILLAACADGRIAAVAAYGAAHQRNNSGYIASLVLDRQVPALQAGCLLMKANLFHKAGGWRLPLSDSLLAGIDLSLRLSASGQRLIWNAQAEAHSDSPALDSIIAQAGADATQLLQHQAPAQWLNNNTFAHQVL